MPGPVKKPRATSAEATKVDAAPAAAIAGRAPALADLISFHGEIRAALDRLALLVRAALDGRPDVPTATFLLRFFEGPLLWHDEDEEVSLLRRLRNVALDNSQAVFVEAMHRGHEKMEAILEDLLRELRALSKGHADVDVTSFERNARSLKSLLDGHLTLEESTLFPLAAKVLSGEELANIHREIEARHGRSSADSVRNKRAIPL